jgi:hypothetical protein
MKNNAPLGAGLCALVFLSLREHEVSEHKVAEHTG